MNFLLSSFTPWAKFKVSSTMTELSISHFCSLPSSGTMCARCYMTFPSILCLHACYFQSRKPLFNLSKPLSSVSVFVTLSDCVRSVAQSCPTLLWPPGLYPARLPLSMGFPKQEYWSVLLLPPPGDLPNLGIEPYLLCVLCFQLCLTISPQILITLTTLN